VRMELVNCPLCGSDRDRQLFIAGPRRMVRCEVCGVVYRNPRPLVSSYLEEFGSGRAEVDDEAWLGVRRRSTFVRFLDAWPDRPGRVLDVGCGGGWFLKVATERGWSGVGVDLSPEAVRHAREVFGVDARRGTLDAQTFAPGSFDLVTLWNVLEVVPDPLALLRAILPLVRAGGTLHLRTPNYPFQRAGFVASRAARALGLRGFIDARPYFAFIVHVTAFSAGTIRLFLARAGFTDVRVFPSRPTPGDPYRTLGRFGEWPLDLIKLVSHGIARTAAAASGGQWIASASLEASAHRPPSEAR